MKALKKLNQTCNNVIRMSLYHIQRKNLRLKDQNSFILEVLDI